MAVRQIGLRATFVVILFAGSGTPHAVAQSKAPPFDWDEKFASPGTSLSIDIIETVSGPPKGTLVIAVNSTGFTETGSTPVLWQKMAGSFYQHKPSIAPDGNVRIIPGTDGNLLGNYVRGQAFDVALVDSASGKRAQAKLTPFPLSVIGNKGCTANAEILAGSGLVWAVTLSGFDAGEKVELTSTANKQTLTEKLTASESGSAAFPILYPPKSKGKAVVTGTGESGCAVRLEFAIGADALKAK